MTSHTAQQFLDDLDKKLWNAADRLRSNIDAADVVLGLIFLKYVSDAFEERRIELEKQFRDSTHEYYLGDDEDLIHGELETRDFYTEKNVFWVPALARWQTLQNNATLAPVSLIQIVNDVVGKIPFVHESLHAKDILGHVYECFLGQFALAEGKKGGQYYTPKAIVSLMVEMLQPFKGRVYDPAMGRNPTPPLGAQRQPGIIAGQRLNEFQHQ